MSTEYVDFALPAPGRCEITHTKVVNRGVIAPTHQLETYIAVGGQTSDGNGRYPYLELYTQDLGPVRAAGALTIKHARYVPGQTIVRLHLTQVLASRPTVGSITTFGSSAIVAWYDFNNVAIGSTRLDFVYEPLPNRLRVDTMRSGNFVQTTYLDLPDDPADSIAADIPALAGDELIYTIEEPASGDQYVTSGLEPRQVGTAKDGVVVSFLDNYYVV